MNNEKLRDSELGPDGQAAEVFNIDTTQFTGGDKEKVKIWDNFARRHLAEMRILKDAGLLGKKNTDWRNVSEHALVAGALAGILAKQLEASGEDVNPELVEAAAILHNAGKRLDIENKVRYKAEGRKGVLPELLKKAGYPENFINMCRYTARVPEIFLDEKDQDAAINKKSIGELLVAYCDARIRNTEIVSLEDARDKNKEKVPKDADFYDKWYSFYKKFEKTGQLKSEDFNNKKVILNLLQK